MKNLLAAAVIGTSLIGCATTPPGMSENDAGFKLANAGQYSQAESYFLRALEANPNNPYALANLGQVYEMSGRFSQSREMYQRLLNVPPNAQPNVLRKFGQGINDETESFHDMAERNLASMKDKADNTNVAFNR